MRQNNTGLIFVTDRFAQPIDLLDLFEEYLVWLDENKLKEAKLYGSEGQVTQLDRMRIPSMHGFQYFLRATKAVMKTYRDRMGQWEEVFSFIEDTMFALSLEGAAAGLLKESIVMRKLGLADKSEQVNTTRRVVTLFTPDNGRAIDAPLAEDAIEVNEEESI